MKPARRPPPGWLLLGKSWCLEGSKTAGFRVGARDTGGKAASEAGPTYTTPHGVTRHSAARPFSESGSLPQCYVPSSLLHPPNAPSSGTCARSALFFPKSFRGRFGGGKRNQ